MIEKINQPRSDNFKRIAKVVLSGVATIASFLFGAAIIVLGVLASLLYWAAGLDSANPSYDRHLLMLEWQGQIAMVPIVYKLIFVSLFFLAVYRIFGWIKIRRENKSNKKADTAKMPV